MTRSGMILYDMAWHDMTWYYIEYDAIRLWYDMRL